jgi:hypothetical protein
MNQEKLFDVVVATIKTNRTTMLALIKKNGIALPLTATDDQIFNAFVSLVRTSAKFREEFALLVKKIEAQVQGNNSFNQDGSTPPPAKGSKTKEYLSQVFTPEVTGNLINNLLGLFGAKGTDLSGGFENANTRFETGETDTKGMSMGAIIGISVGVIALIGLTIYLVKKK